MPSEALPDRQRWATAAARPLGEIASIPTPLLRRGKPTAVVGGKLAAALIPSLLYAGFEGVATEHRHPMLAGIPPEAAEYEAFGSGYGEIHSARAFRQLVERAARSFTPQPDRRHEHGTVVDPFRPNLRYPAASDREFDVQAERNLNAVRSAFRRARTLLVVLSSSEVWENVADGAVYPHWSQDGERLFDAGQHRLRTLTLDETVTDLRAAVTALRGLNPAVEIVFMVSPEPQAATGLPVHVLAAGALGKAVLRIAMETVSGSEGIHYFPAFEIASLVAPASAYGADGTPPSAVATAVVEGLIEISEGGGVRYDGAAAPISVMKASAAPAEQQEKSPPKPRTARPPRGAQAQPVDIISEAQAAEDAHREATRAAKRAAKGRAPSAEQPANGEGERARKLAERQARHQEKSAAREAKRASKQDAAAEDVSQTATAAAGADHSQRDSAADSTESQAAKVKTKRAKRAKAAASEVTETVGTGEQTGATGRRNRKRAAKA